MDPENLKELLKEAVNDTGRDLSTSLDEVALAMSESTARLALSVGQPGFEMALIAERDIVAIKAGLSAVGSADAIDNRIIGVIQGGLSMAARAIAPGA